MSACRIHRYFHHPKVLKLSRTSSLLPCPLSRISALNQKWKRESCENHISLISLTLSLSFSAHPPPTHRSCQPTNRRSSSGGRRRRHHRSTPHHTIQLPSNDKTEISSIFLSCTLLCVLIAIITLCRSISTGPFFLRLLLLLAD